MPIKKWKNRENDKYAKCNTYCEILKVLEIRANMIISDIRAYRKISPNLEPAIYCVTICPSVRNQSLWENIQK